MATLAELIAQRTELEKKIKEVTESGRAESISKIHALMAEYGLTIADIVGSGKPSRKSVKPTVKVAAKYSDKAGNSWSGRGLQPNWLKAELATGKTLQDFAV